jgi:hypothetical protein
LRRKQRLEPLPWRVREVFVFHTDECTSPVGVCKHALVQAGISYLLAMVRQGF